MTKSQKQKQLEKKEATKAELEAKLRTKEREDIQKFLAEFERLSLKYGLTFGGRAFIADDGRISVDVFPVARRK